MTEKVPGVPWRRSGALSVAAGSALAQAGQLAEAVSSGQASGQTTLNVFLAYQFAFGRTAPLPPGIGVFGGGNAAQVRTFDVGTARYRIQVYVQAQNLTNEANYMGYSGTLTSPFFGRPTAVSGMRKIDAGVALNF